MALIPPERFRRALRRLDGAAFADLVEDLWSRTGWDTRRDGQVVVATRHGETRRMLVLPPQRATALRQAPSVDGPIDAVVSSRALAAGRRLPRGTPDADVLDATALRERALYALDREERDAFFSEHLSVVPEGPQWDTRSASDALRASVRDLDPSSAVPVLLVALLGLAIVVALGPAGLVDPGALVGDGDEAAAGSELSGDVSASSPEDESETEAESETETETGTNGVGTAQDTSMYDYEPTCERGPGAVAGIVSSALTGPQTTYGLRIYWDFSNPTYREHTDYSAFVAVHRAAFQNVVEAQSIVLAAPEPVDGADDRVRIEATVVYGAGSQSDWVYELEQYDEEPYEGCWVINRFVQR